MKWLRKADGSVALGLLRIAKAEKKIEKIFIYNILALVTPI